MKIVSLNCGLPREIVWQGMDVTTSIYKDRLLVESLCARLIWTAIGSLISPCTAANTKLSTAIRWNTTAIGKRNSQTIRCPWASLERTSRLKD